MRGAPLGERFHVLVVYGDGGGCWLWVGAKDRVGGYGTIRVDGKTRKAHRVAFELAECAIPEGMHVLHICDVPACVRPTHLRLGTIADNMADRNAKGRQARGSHHSRAKLTDADVLEIRRLYAMGGLKQREIAAVYGIGGPQVSYIVTGKQWTHLPVEGAI